MKNLNKQIKIQKKIKINYYKNFNKQQTTKDQINKKNKNKKY